MAAFGSRQLLPPGGSSTPFAPRGCVRAHSAGQPSARVRAGRSRAYLPRGVRKPTGAGTPRGAQGAGGEQGLRWGLGGSGVICSSCVRVRVASFCTETSSVDEMRSWRASPGGTD